jgi:hypothetical protein
MAPVPAPPRAARVANARDRGPRRGEQRQPAERMRDSDEADQPVTGFGADIPAFMLLAKSKPSVQAAEIDTNPETEESEP